MSFGAFASCSRFKRSTMYGHLQQELQNGLRHEPWYSPWANLLTAIEE